MAIQLALQRHKTHVLGFKNDQKTEKMVGLAFGIFKQNLLLQDSFCTQSFKRSSGQSLICSKGDDSQTKNITPELIRAD